MPPNADHLLPRIAMQKIALYCKLDNVIRPFSKSLNHYAFITAIGPNETEATKTAGKAASSLHFIVNCHNKSPPL
ncbi:MULTISPECIES: hypothetical protein [unclassified Bartonella]|uniref:hypothetical protein n=1 Tax=unclassified Bartonella TaxID=2645622 RepID=UPI0035D01410